MSYTPQEQRILDAALNVMAKHSISGTRMHLIAEEAGMASSNLHYHFKTKQDLLLALLSEIQDRFDGKREAVMDRPARNLRERLEVFFRQKRDFILQEPRYDKVQFDYWLLGQSDETVKKLFGNSFDHWREHLIRSFLEFYPDMEVSMQYLNGDGVDLDAYFALCLDMVIGEIERRYGPSLEKEKNS